MDCYNSRSKDTHILNNRNIRCTSMNYIHTKEIHTSCCGNDPRNTMDRYLHKCLCQNSMDHKHTSNGWCNNRGNNYRNNNCYENDEYVNYIHTHSNRRKYPLFYCCPAMFRYSRRR